MPSAMMIQQNQERPFPSLRAGSGYETIAPRVCTLVLFINPRCACAARVTVVNPRRACAARVTVVGFVCVSVCLSVC